MGRFYFFFFLLILFISDISHSQGFILAVGGNEEDYNSWSDAPYQWLVVKANYGKIINIDVDEASDWYPNYFKHFGAATGSRALQIPNVDSANSDEIYLELKSAQGIFIEGGDQWEYVRTWKGTKTDQAIKEIFQSGGVIGGISAGLAVLGEIVFDAKYGSAYPEKTVYDAYNSRIHFEPNFLSLLPGIFTDSHFTSRGRLGRLVPMLARWMQDKVGANIVGLGVDDCTAICIDPALVGEVFGRSSVTVLYKTETSQIKCEAGKPPYFTNIGYDQLIHGCIYDLKKQKLIAAGPYLQPTQPVPISKNFSSITLDGSQDSTAELGTYVIENLLSNSYNAFYGRLSQRPGKNTIPNSIIIPNIWSDEDFYENRLVGAQWGVATHSDFVSILIDKNNFINVDDNGFISTNKIVHILDSYGAYYSGVRPGSQFPGIIGAKLHFLNSEISYDLKNHCPLQTTHIEQPMSSSIAYFELLQNYPNPFNIETQIRFRLFKTCHVRLQLINELGEQVRELTEREFPAGDFALTWRGESEAGIALASGIYFVQAMIEKNYISRKKILFLK